MRRPRFDTLVSCATAIAFACVAVLPALVSVWTSPGFPVQVFTVDDGLYLQRAMGAWQGFDPYQWSYFETAGTRSLVEVALARPNAVVDVATGWLAHLLDFSPAELAIFLDWSCGALSFAILLAIFRCWADRWVACGAAILAVSFPGVLVPEPLLRLPNAALPMLVSQPFIDHASPAFRAVYTQVSYPLFLLVVLLMVRWYLRESRTTRALFPIGVLGGLAGHGYFFPWLTALAIGVGLPAVGAVVNGRGSLARIASETATLLAGWIVGSAGVFCIMATHPTSGIVGSDLLARYWFFPFERVLLAVVLLGFALRERRRDLCRSQLLAFLGLLLALELPLMNLQPLLRQGLAPYHFPSFYLHPLVTGGIFILLVEWLRTAASFRLLAQVVCALPLLSFTFHSALGVRKALSPLPLAEDLGWLVGRLQATPPDTVFALNPIREPFSEAPPRSSFLLNLPNFVSTLSGRYTFDQEWMFNEMGDDSDLRRELGMSWLLTGTMRPLWKVSEPVELPGDVFTLTWTYLEMRRQQKLALHGGLLRDYTPCAFLSDFRVDLLVHDPTNDGDLPAPESRFLDLDASSPHGTFRVYRFDQARAASEMCRGSGAKGPGEA